MGTTLPCRRYRAAGRACAVRRFLVKVLYCTADNCIKLLLHPNFLHSLFDILLPCLIQKSEIGIQRLREGDDQAVLQYQRVTSPPNL